MTIDELLCQARLMKSSDVHLTKGLPPMLRVNGQLQPYDLPMEYVQIKGLILSMLDEDQRDMLLDGNDLDFAYVDPEGGRYRVNVYRQKGDISAAIRLLQGSIPDLDQLGMPEVFKQLAMLPRGLVLVTGPTGSGKSTSLAAMVDYINTHRRCHILTIEDPVEYSHTHKQAMVNQRELGADITSYQLALRAALREDPDVILVGEMRDLETISAAVTAAETGHLVLSTLHTIGAASTIDRIIDVFPAEHQQQIRIQLASVLKGVITQQLLPKADGSGRIAAFEIMVNTDAINNLIREGKGHQINSAIQTGAKLGMRSLDSDLANLVNQGVCTLHDAQEKCVDKENFMRYLK